MTTYLDVGVQRIGEYLTRVPRLKQLRGASAAISAATDFGGRPWQGPVGTAVQLNDETGRADGVLHLVVPTGDPEMAAREALAVLREQLPGAQLTAAWATADDYPTAYRKMHEPGGRSLTWLPSTNEFPLTRPCGNPGSEDRGCGQRPGGSQRWISALCPDCRRRGPEPDQPDGDEVRLGRAEALLRHIGRPTRSIKDLCPTDARPPASNHVASIAIDGNGVGGYFARLIAQGDSEQRRQVSCALRDATESAVLAGAVAVTRSGRVGVVPVVLGGDDVIVITAAVDAWPFLRTFQAEFDRSVAAKLGPDTGISVSGGIAIHQVKQPVTRTIALADALMRRAKKLHRGGQAAVAWVDMTVDALDEEGALDARPAISIAELEANVDVLGDLASLGQSALANLRREAEELASIPIADTDRGDYIRFRASRIGALGPVGACAYPRPPAAGQLGLEVALDLARWWPADDEGAR